MTDNRTVTFMLGGMVFEYDEEKNQANIKNMVFLFAVPPVCFLIMTALKCMTRRTAWMKSVLTRLGIHPQAMGVLLLAT